jgi:carboxyl-terminal processing protease
MLKLTTARYYTPTGRSIQKPYENGNRDSYSMEVIKRYNHGEMISADSIHFPDSLKYYTNINNRIVYGGGGIMPDYFVPIDTTKYTDMHRSLVASGVVNKFVMNYIDKNRKALQTQYPAFHSYNQHFEVTENMLNNLLSAFQKENFEMIDRNTTEILESNEVIENTEDTPKTNDKKRRTSAQLTGVDRKQFQQSKSLIQLQIKALIARDLWNTSEYYQVFNSENEALKKAIEIIENTNEYYKLLGK